MSEPRSIRMPGSLLDQLKLKGERGEYETDERFSSKSDKKGSKKRKSKELGRKERRKEERLQKKHKKTPSNEHSSRQSSSKRSESGVRQPKTTLKALTESKRGQELEIDLNESDSADEPENLEDTMRALLALKLKKASKPQSSKKLSEAEETMNALLALKLKKAFKSQAVKPISEAEDTMNKLLALKLKKVSKSQDKEMSADETMGALLALKLKKASKSKDTEMSAEETMSKLLALKLKKKPSTKGSSSKEQKLRKAEKSKKDKKISLKTPLMRRDEDDMAYYAKKLGISKNSKLQDIGDGFDDLLDGLDFDFESAQESDDEESEEEQDEEQDEDEEDVKLPYSDDEINSSDFDDIDSDEMREMEELENSEDDSDTESLNEGIEEDSGEDLEDSEGQDSEVYSENESGSDFEDHQEKKKENPYVAPAQESSRYIPPALRRKMQEEAGVQESEETKRLKRLMNSSLNKLSEANFISILSNELEQLYYENPRQTVTELLTEYILNNIGSSTRLLDSYIIVYAGVISAFYRFQGIEFAAFAIQKLVERIERLLKDNAEGKGLNNLVTLFAFNYNFNVFASNLMFDVIKMLCVDVTETKIEMLLKLVTLSGHKMRQEDPSALKDIISLSTKSISEDSNLKLNTRAKFLLETLQNVKNNKMRNSDQVENSNKIVTSLKKQLQTISKASVDPIQVTLDDIHNIDSRGKWWLVGSAWKGHDSTNKRSDVDEDMMNDILDTAEPNWSELADFYRMNTSVRKAIFVAIMSSEGYEEAVGKINKLGLKGHQKFEVPKILLICCSIEPHYNPFYGFVAKEFCKIHDMRKTFQFNLWDLIKEFEGGEFEDSDSDDETGLGRLTSSADGVQDEEADLKKILSLGRLYGFLLGQNSLPLTVLKTINFVTASDNTKLFLEILMVTFLDNVGKLSELSEFGLGKKKSKLEDLRFDDKKLIERIPQNQSILLRGLQYFLQQNVRESEFISGRRQRKRVQWGSDKMCNVIDDALKSSNDR